MSLGRIVFFRLHESPRYLVHVGRKQDALEPLRMISRFNDSELALDLDEVEDHIRVPRSHLSDSAFLTENRLSSSRLFNADSELSSPPIDIKVPSSVAQAGIPPSSTPPDGTEYTTYQRLHHWRFRGTPFRVRLHLCNYRASLVPVPFYPSGGANVFSRCPSFAQGRRGPYSGSLCDALRALALSLIPSPRPASS